MTQHELDVILQGGEGYKVEFKRNINSDLAKELVAFANSSGGRVFIGIEDNGSISGVHVNNDLKSRVEASARDCDPSVRIELEAFNNVLIVSVPEGNDKPYRCTNGFYIRSGASSVKLSTQEIIEFIKTEGRIRFEDLHAPEVNFEASLDEIALKRFTSLSGISEVIGKDEMLINLGVLYSKQSLPVFNNAGILLFAKKPADILPHAIISCVLFKGNKKVHIIDRKILEFDLLTNIDQAVAFLERHLNLSYEIKNIRRSEILEIPKNVIREAIINAVAHRDYFERGANVVVEIYDGRVEISNPGGLPKGLKPENFGKHSLARNPLIAGLLHRCNYIEKAGTGIQRMRDGMKDAGLPEPIFEFSQFFTVIFQRKAALAAQWTKELKVRPDKLRRLMELMQILYSGNRLDIETFAAKNHTSGRSIRKDLEFLQEKGWVLSSGITKSKSYHLTEIGKQKAADIQVQ